jgi:hypothetical protein
MEEMLLICRVLLYGEAQQRLKQTGTVHRSGQQQADAVPCSLLTIRDHVTSCGNFLTALIGRKPLWNIYTERLPNRSSRLIERTWQAALPARVHLFINR